jgi:hypothetical protein
MQSHRLLFVLLLKTVRTMLDASILSDSSWTVFLVAVEHFQEESLCVSEYNIQPQETGSGQRFEPKPRDVIGSEIR